MTDEEYIDQQGMLACYGRYEMDQTIELASKVFPDIDSLIVGAVAMLEMAKNNAPCTGPAALLQEAINSCKAALLLSYDKLPNGDAK